MKRILPLALLVLATVAACATPNLEEPDLLVTDAPHSPRTAGSASGAPSGSAPSGSAPSPPSGSGAPPGAPPDAGVDAAPDASRWQGSLAATQPAGFGGGQECLYRITLKQVTADVRAAANGDIVAATVTARAFEQVLSSGCPNQPIPEHLHTYVLVSSSVLPSGARHLELASLASNHPAASLVIEGDFRVGRPVLALAWHRTDYGPPLDWRIAATVTVDPE